MTVVRVHVGDGALSTYSTLKMVQVTFFFIHYPQQFDGWDWSTQKRRLELMVQVRLFFLLARKKIKRPLRRQDPRNTSRKNALRGPAQINHFLV